MCAGSLFRNSRNQVGKFVVFSLCLFAFVFSGLPRSFGEQQLSVDERLLKMEEQMKALQDRNEQLQMEVEQLRRQLEEEEQPVAPPPSELPLVPPVEQVKVTPEFDVGYKNGFFISSEDGEFGLRLGGRLTSRYTAFTSETPLEDQFSVKRARLETEATLMDYYLLRLQVEFADASKPTSSYSVKLKDGYIDVNYFPEARLRIGQFKVPFSFEALQSHKYLDFVDLSLAVQNLRAGRDIGMMLFGGYHEKLLQYQLALINGSGENNPDNNSEKDVAARVVLLPFLNTGNELLSSMQFGVSGTFGDEDLDLSSTSFRTISGTEFVAFTSGTSLEGDRSRLGTEFIWPFGPASLKSELMWMWLQDLENDGVETDADFTGWYISGTYLLTGEKKTLGRLVPRCPFDPFKQTWGAWEVAAQYSVFESDSDLFDLGLATGTDKAESFTIGLNWYLNPYTRMILDYEHTEFANSFVFSGETVTDEDVILVQCQLEF